MVEADLSAGLGTRATNDTLITNDGVAATDTGAAAGTFVDGRSTAHGAARQAATT